MDGLRFTVWGVRGSFPAAADGYLGYGGNTSCFSVRYGRSLFVFDAGSGLAELGRQIMGNKTDVESVHLFIGHTHMDHVMGLYPFLSYCSNAVKLHFYGTADLRKRLETLTDRPFWPCSVAESGARFHKAVPWETAALPGCDGRVLLSAMEGTHPGGCLWYRLFCGGKTVVYLLDCEPEERKIPEMLRFAEGADLLVWDGHYAPGQEKPGWGHSTWEKGLEFAVKAGVKKVLIAHYSDDCDDARLRDMEKAARAGSAGAQAENAARAGSAAAQAGDTAGGSGSDAPQGGGGGSRSQIQTECIFAKEGMVIGL